MQSSLTRSAHSKPAKDLRRILQVPLIRCNFHQRPCGTLSLEVKKSHLILCQREFGDPRSRTRQILSTLSMPRTTPVAPASSRKSRGREAKLSSRTICHAMCAAIATPPGKWHSVGDAGMTKLMRQVHATSARAFTSRCRQDVCPQG